MEALWKDFSGIHAVKIRLLAKMFGLKCPILGLSWMDLCVMASLFLFLLFCVIWHGPERPLRCLDILLLITIAYFLLIFLWKTVDKTIYIHGPSVAVREQLKCIAAYWPTGTQTLTNPAHLLPLKWYLQTGNNWIRGRFNKTLPGRGETDPGYWVWNLNYICS